MNQRRKVEYKSKANFAFAFIVSNKINTPFIFNTPHGIRTGRTNVIFTNFIILYIADDAKSERYFIGAN